MLDNVHFASYNEVVTVSHQARTKVGEARPAVRPAQPISEDCCPTSCLPTSLTLFCS